MQNFLIQLRDHVHFLDATLAELHEHALEHAHENDTVALCRKWTNGLKPLRDLLYNAGNDARIGDPSLPSRVYTAGQALFDATNPLRLLDRTDAPFLRPTEPYEKTGQYKEGTTFVEGLVPFRGRWLLYYGTADSRVGVATADR